MHNYEVRDLNNKKNKTKFTAIIAIITISILAALSLSGCTTFDNFKKAFIDKPQDKANVIQIGVFEPMSGADKEGASLEVEGIEIAHELYPTLNGKDVELVYADNNSDIDAAETAIDTLISHEPVFILGSYGNVYSLAASSHINEAKIPSIAITNTNPLITKNYKYYCRLCYVDTNQGILLAKYVVKDKKVKRAGVLIPKGNDAATVTASAFADYVRSETKDDDAVTLYEEFEPGTEDYTEVLNKVKKAKVKQVLLTGDMPDDANIINQAAKMKLDVQFLGSADWGTEDFKGLLDNSVQSSNIAFVQFFAADGDDATKAVSKEKDAFLNAYKQKHGQDAEPEDAVALGYDAYCLALDAISKAPEGASSEEIIDMITGPDYTFEGASGLINFNKVGDPIETSYIGTWTKGQISTLYTIEPEE